MPIRDLNELLTGTNSSPKEVALFLAELGDTQSLPTFSWTHRLAEVREKGYKSWQIDDLLGFDQQKLWNDSLRIKYKDVLDTTVYRLDGRIHQALVIAYGLQKGWKVNPWAEFLIPVATTPVGLFDFMNAGLFVLRQNTAHSSQIFPETTFVEAIDELCIDMADINYPVLAALRKYSSAFHHFVWEPLDFQAHAAY